MVEACTSCGQRHFVSSPNWGTLCETCHARQFEKHIAAEIQRATSKMPPRRERAPWRATTDRPRAG